MTGQLNDDKKNHDDKEVSKKKSSIFARAIYRQLCEIVRYWPFGAAIFCALATLGIAIPSPLSPSSRPTLLEFCSLVLTVNGFGFTISIAAVVLVVGFPETRFKREMMLIVDQYGFTPYEVLAFNFTWTALINCISAAACLVVSFLVGKSEVLNYGDFRGIVGGMVVVGLVSYSIFMAIASLYSLYSLASLSVTFNNLDPRKNDR